MNKNNFIKCMLGLLLGMVCNVAWADGPFRNHRYDSFKALNVTSDNIVFIGNSITDMHCWPEVFKTSTGEYLPIVNRGNSGTYSTEQSDNLESYINGKPKKVFMMIGTNDIATSGGLNFSPEQVLAYVKSIVTRIHARSPQTKVYLYSILKNNTSNRVEATWLKANELTKAYADATDKVTYIDLYDKLANVASGGAWSYDNLHLTAGAYQVWAKEICQYLQEDENYTVSCVYPENTLTVQNRGGLSNASHGMRATYFSCLPISTNDVLVFGDSFIKNGEWQEFLGNRNVKNRGTGWGNSGEISTTSGIVDATFATIDGVEKTAPKAIFLYTGTGDCTGSTDIATVKTNYKALVDKLAEKAPNAKIYLMAICPRNNASHNTRIAELNAYMESIATGNIRFVDTYTPFINDGTVNSKYVFSNDYIGGLAYIKIANLMKTTLLADFPSDTYNVTSEADAETRYAQAGLRNQLTQAIARGLVAERGDAAGQYNATKMAVFDTKVSAANTILEKTNITQDEVTTFTGELNTILNGALSMPTNSTEGNEVWYQLYTPGRGNKYLASTGAGAGVNGTAANNYATSMWKFVERTNGGGLDIINRHDGSYLAPTAASNTQLTTSATQPTNAWSLSYSDAPGLFVINSGTVQLHQTNDAAVWNWGGGSNRSDAGCQYQIEMVEGEPDEIPDPSLLTMTFTSTELKNGASTYTKHTASGDGWYGKLVTGTTPALTIESTNETANNIGWSNNQPWLQPGYTYNITLPEDFVFVGYELTTKSVLGFTGTYTYITATGTATSEAQSDAEKTVAANGLNTKVIALKVGDAVNTGNGILITKLVIRYKAVDKGIYALEVKESTGAFTTGTKVWTMSGAIGLTFTSNANNMNVDGGYLQIHPGTAGTATYTIAVPEPYAITGYSFDYAFGNSGTGNKTITVNEQQYAVAAEKNTLTISDLNNVQSTQFTLAGSNQPVKLTNFVVNVINPEILEEEEETEVTYTIDKTNGNLYNGTSANQSWNSAWRSNAEPQLVFSCGANNMNWVENTVQLMSGQAGSATYTLTAPEGYVISKYSFTFANNNHNTALSLAMNGGSTYTTSTTAQTISAESQKLNTVSFTLSGSNGNGVLLTNFSVTISDPSNAEEDGEETELAAAKTTAKATVTANAANLKEALGYYSYTVGGTKVYSASAVTEAIDEAATVAAVEAIVATYALNLPEVGKYYRIKGNGSGKYLDAVNRHSGNQMGMKTEAERDFLGSIFLLDEGSKLLNMGTNTYIKDTHSIGADKNGANTWTFEASPRTLGCLLVKSNAGSPYLHDSGYANRCSGDAGHAEHDFVLEEVSYLQLTVNVQSKVFATATWKGVTKVLPNTWSVFDGEPLDNTILTINSNASYTCTGLAENDEEIHNANTLDIGVLSENRTLTANFTPNFFSATYGDKWVRIQNCNNGSYWANVESGELNGKGKTATLDNTYTDEKQLWCLVGDANSFILYNKAAGSGLALGTSDYNQGTLAQLVNKTGVTWKLKEQEFGYAIMPASADNTSERGINMWGGDGGELKLYATAEGNKGSYWKIEAANPFTLSVEVEAGQPYANNTRVCEITKVIAGRSSKSIILDNVSPTTCYLPSTATFTLDQLTYRGYIFNGFVDAGKNAMDKYTDAYLPDGGLSLTASYSVDENNKYQYLFYYRDDVNNKPYRIPAITTARNNTVLAFSDYRPCGNDIGFGEVDIVLRRSYDNGKTWSDAVTIADGQGGNENVFNAGFGDAAVVADRESDKVLVMAVAGKQVFLYGSATSHNSMARILSSDNGENWVEPEDMTSKFFGERSLFPEAYTMFFGSGRLLQSRLYKKEGADFYRVYGALLVKHANSTYTGEANYVVYSDDFGETWNILGGSVDAGMCCNGGNEPKVEELPDGTIVLSSRKGYGRYFNVFTYSNKETGEGTWGSAVQSHQQTGGISFGGNSCNGEIYKVKAIHKESGRICDVMLQSVPTGSDRSNVSVYYKEMQYGEDNVNNYTPKTFAENWTKGIEVSALLSAYSTMTLQADGNFGFFFEEWPDANYAYSMVYVPLSLEEITEGAYSLYTVNSTITSHGIATFYATSAMQIPEGVKAYVVEADDLEMNGENGYIAPTELEGIIPANTGAILMGDAETYKFIPSISYGTHVEGNMLVGYEAADNKAETQSAVTLPEGSTVYVLAVENEKAGFYKKNAGFNVYNNKAYLNVPGSAAARAIYFDFGGETGILETENGDVKTENCYDLSGRRVEKAQKGVYIVNGKKVLK